MPNINHKTLLIADFSVHEYPKLTEKTFVIDMIAIQMLQSVCLLICGIRHDQSNKIREH